MSSYQKKRKNDVELIVGPKLHNIKKKKKMIGFIICLVIDC